MMKPRWMVTAKKLLLMLAAILCSTVTFAQGQSGTDELMRSNGKIYVVVAVCLTILIGLFIYVFMVDRKISKLEKDN